MDPILPQESQDNLQMVKLEYQSHQKRFFSKVPPNLTPKFEKALLPRDCSDFSSSARGRRVEDPSKLFCRREERTEVIVSSNDFFKDVFEVEKSVAEDWIVVKCLYFSRGGWTIYQQGNRLPKLVLDVSVHVGLSEGKKLEKALLHHRIQVFIRFS